SGHTRCFTQPLQQVKVQLSQGELLISRDKQTSRRPEHRGFAPRSQVPSALNCLVCLTYHPPCPVPPHHSCPDFRRSAPRSSPTAPPRTPSPFPPPSHTSRPSTPPSANTRPSWTSPTAAHCC